MPYLQPMLLMGLKNIEEYQVCTVSVGVVGDVCRALNAGVVPFCDDIMRCLLELLQSPALNRYALIKLGSKLRIMFIVSITGLIHFVEIEFSYLRIRHLFAHQTYRIRSNVFF
jgi:hypothetical protein